jgi:hypothetical protein
MEQTPTWEANSLPDSQEISYIVLNLKAYCCVHKSLPLVPVLSQMNPVLCKIL